jgi:hypothetical protein
VGGIGAGGDDGEANPRHARDLRTVVDGVFDWGFGAVLETIERN